PALHVVRLVKKMHRSAEPARAAGFFTKKLRHACIGARAPGQGMTVIAVRSDDVIIGTHRSNRSGHDGFLTNVEMTKSANLLRLILLTGAFLEAPDQQH